jgi:hypothetical protein
MDVLERLATTDKQYPCKEESVCKNSPLNSLQPKCSECRLSVVASNFGWMTCHWAPKSHKDKHPIIEQEKKRDKLQRLRERAKAKHQKDRGRQRVLKEAARAEKQTERRIIKATRNSGRSNRDGDHVSNGNIVLDTKHQSTIESPVVKLHELDKVRADAKRSGNGRLGGLVLRNKHGRGIVVFAEEDYAKLKL